MNENYTSGVQKILKNAKKEAIRLGHTYVGSEHFLLGIIKCFLSTLLYKT